MIKITSIGLRAVIRFAPVILCAALAMLGEGVVSAQTKVGTVCANSKGAVVVRSSCLSGEKKVTLSFLSSKGATGGAGSTGPTGASGYQVVSTALTSQSISQTGSNDFTIACPAGKAAIGGGCYTSSNFVSVYRSYPSLNSNSPGWVCNFASRNPSSPVTVGTIIIYAICVNK